MLAPVRDHLCRFEVVGQGPTVLLVMGFGMSGLAWRPIVDRLASRFRVCWYDVRGIGGSSRGRLDRHDLPDLADDAAALLEHLGWDDAHVAGVSMGGMIAQHLALRHRARLRSLALIATHCGGGLRRTGPTPEGLRLFLQANRARGEARLAALERLLYPPGVRPQAFGPEERALLAQPAAPGVRLLHLRGILRHDTRPHLHRLGDLPTLVVRPDLDVLVPPRCSDHLVECIPRARLLAVRDAGHGLISQHPDRVASALAEHFVRADLG